MCMYCGHLAIFARDLRLRDITPKEFAVICEDEKIVRLLRLRQKYMRDVGLYRRTKP